MVAYSFRPRFADAIVAGLEPEPLVPGMKRQTIRADRRRHARAGEELQLYTGMRTRTCRLLGRARCVAVEPVRLLLVPPYGVWITADDGCLKPRDPRTFAVADGFASWPELVAFWVEQHPGVERFDGLRIRWEPLGGGGDSAHG